MGVTRSHGAVGTSAENAAVEAFNATLKRESFQGAKRWPGARAARLAVFRWITRYNTRGRHSALTYLSPIEFEQRSVTLALAAEHWCPHLGGSPPLLITYVIGTVRNHR